VSQPAQTALITGAAKRVGRIIAQTLAANGYNIALHYHISRNEAEQTAAEIHESTNRSVTLLNADLSNTDSYPLLVTETLNRFKSLSLLVNNASAFNRPGESIDTFTPHEWESIYRVNLIAPAALAHHAAEYLAEAPNGSIINISDISAERPWPDHLGYCVSKAALNALTKGLARAMAPNVRVNAVAPGIAIFPDDYSEKKQKAITSRVPLERQGTPIDIADAVLFLANSKYITGQIINVDGGRSVT
jgi:pteridine reductase